MLTGYSYDVKEFADEISNTFRSDFKNNIEGLHPGRFCPKCHAAVKHFTSRGSLFPITPIFPGSLIMNNSVKLALYVLSKQNDWPKKHKPNGRHVMSLDGKNLIPPCVKKMLSHLIAIKVKQSTLANNTIQVQSVGPQFM